MGWAARLNTTPRTGRRVRVLSAKARRDAARATFSAADWIRHAFGLEAPAISQKRDNSVTRDLTITRVPDESEAA